MSSAPRPMVSLVFVLALVVPLAGTPWSAQAAKPPRGVVSDIRELGHSDRFVITGRLKQTYRRGPVVVQQRFNGGRWTAYSRTRTTSAGRLRIPVEKRGSAGDIVCYRLVVPGGKGYRRTVVQRASRGRYAGKRFCIETTFG